jgi:hypothetical protein
MGSSQFDAWEANDVDHEMREAMAEFYQPPSDESMDAMFFHPAYAAEMERRAAYANGEAA